MADTTIDAPARVAAAPVRHHLFESWEVPVYRIILIGSALAFIAFNAWSPAQGVVAYELTGNNRAVGIVVFGQGLAMTFLNPIAGAIADRMSKRFLILACQIVAFVTMITTGILVFTDVINIPLLALGSFTVGTMFAFNGPARNALLGDIMPEERLGNAVALMQVGANFARTAAPFLAGALLAWEAVGATGTYFFMAAVMGIVILTYRRLPPTPMRANRNDTSLMEDVRVGFDHVRETPHLVHALVSYHSVAMLGFGYTVLMPGFSIDVLHSGNAGVGVLLGAAAAGGVVTSLLAAGLADSRHASTMLHLATLMLGVALMLTAIAPNLLVAAFTMALVGGGSSAFQTLNNVVALQYAKQEFFGRVMGFMFMAWGFTNLAGLPVGFLADAYGERTVIAGMGVLLCIATVFFALWGRTLDKAVHR
ncbi:MAG: MFS transporter [Dehalococcoidia bacterium]